MPFIAFKHYTLAIKFLFIAIAACLIMLLLHAQKKLSWNFDSASATSLPAPLYFKTTLLKTNQPYNHASSIALTNMGAAHVVWVGGDRELGHIFVYHFTSKNNRITALFNKQFVEKNEYRYVHSLGNPVIVFYHKKLWLFFTSTSGGWATASINFTISSDEGVSWSKPKQLILSPLLNITNNLKGAPIFFKDGTLGLPIYSEFGSDSGKLLRLNTQGNVLSLKRLSWNHCTIEPFVVPMTQKIAYVFMRSMCKTKHVFMSETQDGGKSWHALGFSSLPNNNNEIAAVKMDSAHILTAFNNTKTGSTNLSFAILNTTLQPMCIIPFKSNKQKYYAYPFLLHNKDHYVLSYTDNHQIALVYFNHHWLEKAWQHCIK